MRINQDALGSCDKCIAAARSLLLGTAATTSAPQSVCVDNTNMDIATRQKWVQLAKQCNVKVCMTILLKSVMLILSTRSLNNVTYVSK